MSITTMQGNMASRIRDLWRSGRQVAWFVSDETARCVRGVRSGVKSLNATGQQIKIISHDRWSGLRAGLPNVPMAKNKTNTLAAALQLALMTQEEVTENFGDLELPFSPEDDVLFVFESVDEEIKSQPLTLTLIRNTIQCNMASPLYVKDKFQDESKRGRRMLVFVSATSDFPASIPELKPEVIPLPDYSDLKQIVLDVLEPLFDLHKESKGKKGIAEPPAEQMDQIINSLHGLTAQDAEEIVSLALIKCNGLGDIDAMLDLVEHEKAKALGKIPGLRYIPKQEIVAKPLPGYEELTGFLDARLTINTEKAKEHGITPLRGIALGGAPGCGKTEVAKYVARRLGRICLLWNLGESKGGIVGASEQNTRQVIQAARAMKALVLCDDVDKGALGGAAKSYGGDGGTTGSMVQMLLTEMSDPYSEAVYIFTFNRVPDMPELLRPGRVDERFYVERPNAKTRHAIMVDHAERVKLKVDDDAALKKLAYSCNDWTGAELAHILIKEEAIRALADGTGVMQVARMENRAKSFVPMVKQKSFSQDIHDMEEACSQFRKIGCIPMDEQPKAAETSGRARRTATIDN